MLTNKNLGVAVVTRDWITCGRHYLLSDPLNYNKIDKARADLVFDGIKASIIKLTTEIHHGWNMEESDPQFFKSLRSKMPEDLTVLPEIPLFYAIPKIHKNY